jgi:hypothetical protein
MSDRNDDGFSHFDSDYDDDDKGIGMDFRDEMEAILDEYCGADPDTVFEAMLSAIDAKIFRYNIARLYRYVIIGAYYRSKHNDEEYAEMIDVLLRHAKKQGLDLAEVKELRLLTIKVSVYAFRLHGDKPDDHREERSSFLKDMFRRVHSYLTERFDLFDFDPDPYEDDSY